MTSHDSTPNPAALTPRGGLVLSCATLLAIMLAVTFALAAWNFARHGSLGIWASLAASLLCTGSSLASLLISVRFAGTVHALAANLGVMLVRMGAPLVGLAVLPKLLPEMNAAGLLLSILILYLVGLATETLLALRHALPDHEVAKLFASRKSGPAAKAS